MSTASTSVPDLLQRFAPAPHCVTVVIDDVELESKTNDPALISALRRASSPIKNGRSVISVRLKVLRDHHAPSDGSVLRLLAAGPLVILLMGTGTVLAMDCERREILGFLAPSTTADQFIHELLPILFERLQGAERFPSPTQTNDLL